MQAPVLRAAAVHLLTACGAPLALLALIAAKYADWRLMFVWLGLSLLVDAADGPLARKADVAAVLPRWSGERLDLIVDYLTYVVVPAFALSQADLLPEPARLLSAIAILLCSLFHFSDRSSKTEEGYFVGFPAIWSIVAFYLFALGLNPVFALLIVLLLVVLTFVPLLYVHPFRSTGLRWINIAVTGVWVLSAGLALLHPFPSPLWIKLMLVLTGGYLLAAGFYASLQARGGGRAGG